MCVWLPGFNNIIYSKHNGNMCEVIPAIYTNPIYFVDGSFWVLKATFLFKYHSHCPSNKHFCWLVESVNTTRCWPTQKGAFILTGSQHGLHCLVFSWLCGWDATQWPDFGTIPDPWLRIFRKKSFKNLQFYKLCQTHKWKLSSLVMAQILS